MEMTSSPIVMGSLMRILIQLNCDGLDIILNYTMRIRLYFYYAQAYRKMRAFLKAIVLNHM